MPESQEELSLHMSYEKRGGYRFTFRVGDRLLVTSVPYADKEKMRQDIIAFIRTLVSDQFTVYDHTNKKSSTAKHSVKRIRECARRSDRPAAR